MTKLNTFTVNHQWRMILREEKYEELQKDIQILKSTFERVKDRYR